MSDIKRAFRTTKVKTSTFSKEAQASIEQLYTNLEAARADAVKAERAAGLAYNEAMRRRAAAQQAELELLREAAEHSNMIAAERVWEPYRSRDGEIVFEAVTRRLARNFMRAQTELLGRELAENNESTELDRNDLYEEPGSDEEAEG